MTHMLETSARNLLQKCGLSATLSYQFHLVPNSGVSYNMALFQARN